jgi:FdhD protein
MTNAPYRSQKGLSRQQEGQKTIQRALPEETAVAMVYNGTTQAVMMATPADIEDFATGFSLTEGFITSPAEITEMEVASHDLGIEARMWLSQDRTDSLNARRRQMAGAVGCGLCGIESLEQAVRPLPPVGADDFTIAEVDVISATDALRGFQPLHDRTHAVHAAGFLQPGEGIVLAREDVGRHNALDKLIGALARKGMDASQGAIVLTSRVSVEMVQKCAMAGTPVLIAVSAPTAHAVRLAEGAGITLAAFARGGGYDVYTHPKRIKTEDPDVA